MKFNQLLILSGLILLFCIRCSEGVSEEENSVSYLVENFENVPREYKTVPFLSLNGLITKEELEFQLREFKENGFGGVFMHPRPGLITEYLSDEWFELIKYSVELAKELDMDVWLYDENSFPSGFAGGHVQDQMPESYNQGIGLIEKRYKSIHESNTKDAFLVLHNSDSGLVDITPKLKSSLGMEDDFYVYEKVYDKPSAFIGGFPYVDLLVDGVTQKFIEVTMRGYENTVAEEFGGIIPGIFTDEPNIGRGGTKNSIRWSPDLFSEFEKQWGYDIKLHLPSLKNDVGEYRKVRHNYYQTLLQMFIDRWAKPWYQYTEDNNLVWTGHYWEHGWPDPHHGGDNMAMYAWHQMPGIDMLFNTTSLRPDQFGNNRAVKELASVANQFDRKRTLSETYGASGWDLSFEDMLRNGNWEYALGVNFMNQHLAYYSMLGTRKYDFPQSISYQVPSWDEYKILNDYFERLSFVLSNGKQINNLLIIEPTTSAWMYASENPGKKIDSIAKLFEEYINQLELMQIEYDLGSENIIKDQGRVDKNQFIINKRAYNTVILPPGTENIDSKTFELLKQFTENNGLLINLSGRIEYIDGSLAEESLDFIPDISTSELDYASISSQITTFLSYEPDNNGLLYHHRRQFDDGEVLFFTNFSKTEPATFSLNGHPYNYLYQLDAFSGKITNITNRSRQFIVNQAEGIIILGSDRVFSFDTSKVDLVENYDELIIENPVVERTSDNVLVLDYLTLKTPAGTIKNTNYYDATMELFSQNGFPNGNPWTVAVQFKDQIISRDTFTTSTAFEASYFFEIDQGVNLGNLQAKVAVENSGLYEVFINGHPAHPTGDYYLDRGIDLFGIQEFLKQGTNVVTLKAPRMSVYAELEPIFVLGNFALQNNPSGGWKIFDNQLLDYGDWINLGLPNYPSGVTYSFEMKNGVDNEKIELELDSWSGMLAKVSVNNDEAGYIIHPPYRLDITTNMKSGNNKIVVEIFGSLRNTLGPFHQEERQGIVTPWSWKYPPEKQPQGIDYNLQTYGVLDEIKILKY